MWFDGTILVVGAHWSHYFITLGLFLNVTVQKSSLEFSQTIKG